MVATPLRRANVAAMAASMGLVTLPHFERLPLWVSTLTVLCVLWRLHLSFGALPLPRKWLLFAVVGAASIGIYVTFGTLFGRDAGVALLVVMLALKLLEMETLRDATVVIFLSYFVVLTNLLYSQTIPTAGMLLVGVWAITATMVGLHWRGGAERPVEALRLSGTLLVQAVPLMLILFLFFPRVQGPIWGLPQDAFSGISGLSDSMSPGTLSHLTLSDAVAFRVNFRGEMPKPPQLYWRGPVLWYFDGSTWHVGLSLDSRPATFAPGGSTVSYVVTMEPHNRRWMFALDLPAKTPPGARIAPDFQLLSYRLVRQRTRYEMTSHTEYRLGYEGLSAYERRRALQLPDGRNWRAHALAENMRRAAPTDRDFIAAVLSMFRTQKFYYTLSPPLLGEDPVDDFLFNTRSGFCEHYASAFVFLMRAAGLPARVVTGYQGGEINPVGNYMIVRQSDAHAWAEVWLEDDGWVRFDPTAAVSPLRVEAGIAAAVPASDPLPRIVRGEWEWLRQARFTWDSLSNTWNQWVLGYNPERQYLFLTRVGMDRATWQTLLFGLLVAAGVVTLVFALVLLRRLRARPTDPALVAWERFCRKLARAGMPRLPHEGPLDFAGRAAAALPPLGAAIERITRLYVALRYGAPGPDASIENLQRQVDSFRIPRQTGKAPQVSKGDRQPA